MQRNLSSSRHAESDGQTERVNQSLEQHFRCFVSYRQDDWSDWLPKAEFAYNNSEHSSTKTTPFYANYGFHPRMDNIMTTREETNPSVEQRLKHLQDIRNFLQEELKRSIEAMKHFADRRRTDKVFKIGDLVMLRRAGISTERPCEKLDFRNLGPFKITKNH